jgi:pimeloyl-ACP methyl ester carboxylesterase
VSSASLRIEPISDPEALVADLESRARRFETPCRAGTIVWRSWGSGPPVLLTHGAQGAWSHWIRNIDALAAERTVWAVDLPGYGDSALAKVEDHAEISAALAAGISELIGNEPIDMVGFSFGGVACAYLAAYHPQFVRRLILVGTGGLGTPVGSVEMKSVRKLQGEERSAAHRFNLLGLMLHKDADDLAIHVQESNVFRSRLNPIGLVLPDKLAAILPSVSAPVDAIWGEYDRPHPEPAAQEAVLRHIQPNMDFRVIADAGHWVMYERPEAFDHAVLDMLRAPLRSAL